MKNMKMAVFLCLTIGLLGCRKRLDDFLFSNDNEITQYFLDSYVGGELPDLPNSYIVPNGKIHQFKYKITNQGKTLNISAIFIGDTSSIKTDTVILYCHGNKDHMDNYWNRQKLLSFVGGFGRYGVLMFDYPGYGLSEGSPTEENVYESTGGAIEWLKSKGLSNERFIIYGYSLGSASACKAVGDKPFVLKPNKIILEAPFASSEVMVQDASLLNMPGSFFVNAKIDNAEQIKKCAVPLYWLHGINDEFLSISTHGNVVYKNHTHSWRIKDEVPGAGHSNAPTFMGYEKYKSRVLSFILSE